MAWDEDSDEEEEEEDDADDAEDAEEDDEEEEDEEDSDDDEEDSDEEEESSGAPSNKSATNLAASVKTLKPPAEDEPKPAANLKPAQPRRSNDEKSVADSDASYDLVSGATSRAPGSPQQEKKKTVAEEDEDSEEEDWE